MNNQETVLLSGGQPLEGQEDEIGNSGSQIAEVQIANSQSPIANGAERAGAELLDELAHLLRRFVVLPKWGAETLALWTLHTYAFELREVTTYVGIESPEKRCWKTTLLGVLSELVRSEERRVGKEC